MDGTMKGYDLELVKKIRSRVSTPLTILGGAGNLDHIENLVKEFGIIGASAGSLFVFKGVYRAVLINYPEPTIKDNMVKRALGLSL
jgi:cyclase